MFLFFASGAIAQDKSSSWTIEVKGQVTENDKKLPGAVITVYDGNSVANSINSSDGKFDFQLSPEKDYVLTFSKGGYITKRINFSTKGVPPERGKYGFSPFTIEEVDIFPEIEGTNVDEILQQPVAKIGYDPKFHNGDFTFDAQYTESIQNMLDKILEAKRALDAQYKKLIGMADAEFQKKTYTEAKTNYTAALKLKPNEQYPKDQLAAIEKALEAQKLEDEKNAQALAAKKALENQYDSVIKLADAAYNRKDYGKARPLYSQASIMLPNRRYPKDQMALIDKALADQKKALQNVKPKTDVQYDSVIKLADAAFNSKDYPVAKSQYNAALQLKPSRQYPRQQLAAINRLTAPKPKKDTVVKVAPKPIRHDSVKPPPPPAPAIHVEVLACNIKGMSDSCKKYIRPFLYGGVNALHIPLRTSAQEKEINIPAFTGERYRIIIDISAMPQGTTVVVSDQDNTHKKRKEFYTLGDAARRIGFIDAVSKSGRFFVDYEIPPNTGNAGASGCAVIMFGYENNK